MKKMLIAYYSYSGNTAWLAEQLSQATGAPAARIETIAPYPADYDDTVNQAKREVEQGFVPAIEPIGENADDFDIVAIGTPVWWYTMAPAVRAFIEAHDWTGKTVVPFVTDAGWPGTALADIESACAGARGVESFEARFDAAGGGELATPERDVRAWTARVAALLED